ncbi:SabA family sialic acid-binding adhesin [Helicobacter pylori]|uniref:Outer membrane protein HopZ n=1 Tax=Helicobacter pylori Hp H-24 TaxID=992039 RepID=I9S899_HELPX|nr:SabA family sialic acid-binding adhesin [Helicobacter pylori]EJB52999.1 outer membrane protein HopZ [Helicobacter pylori Hp H-24]EJC20547.1 outer membrane protein family protein [Helicobacter pylori Hp H-24c]EJC42518.1 outer membrane protein HopZ [Helicobacter pylori Hp M2]EJC43738.1 outer membrane protein HopZ [Helicobacter pylori Hp M3]EJC45334.1 outer membrane protein HopZ [Helicobacter pylori Hp M4]
MKKTFLLSLSLAASLLNAEDNGFFISAGYQIGEAAQMVKNTGELKKLSDTYENLSNLLSNFNNLNQAVTNASSPSEINAAIDNLRANTQGLTGEKDNSPAYQAVSLALNAAVGLWNVIGYAIMCGNGNGTGSGPGSVVFNNQPGVSSTSITCNRYEATGPGESMSIQEFEKLNKAYQAIQQALKNGNGFPVLDGQGTNVKVEYTYECKQTTADINGGVEQFCQKNGSSNGVTSNGSNNKKTQSFIFTNTAQNLLEQASTIMNVLNTQCPLVRSTNNENAPGNGSPWNINADGNACQIFRAEFSAVTSMIKNAQEIVAQAQSLNNNQSNQNAPQDFNPYTSADKAFAQNMLNHAQAQAKMLELADQMKKDLSTIPRHFITDYLAACHNGGGTLPNEGVTNNTWGAGCAYVEETITALNNSLAHFGTQAEQIKQSELLARTILDFRGSLSTLNNTYNSITTTASNTPNSPFLKNLISQSTNPNNPGGLQAVYQVNQSAYSQLLSATQELGHNPFRRVGLISSQTNNGAMNGIGVQVGYKQFFGEKRRWGLRYYGFFDYNHAYIKSSFFNSASDVFTYGVGTDVLYNFINDKATKNSKISFGVFGGIALAGTSWLNSQYVNLATFNNFYNAKMNVANFQFLFNLGLRMNLAKNKKKASDHAAQHGMELGVKIPTINTNYYSLLGTQLQYRRLYSVYLNYVFAY